MKESVESIIDTCDEVILVENGSRDNTWEICQELSEKYPQKVRIFRYLPEVYPLFSDEFARCPEDSVHNFAYMSNYALSKVSYKYAIKMDDDGIFLPHNIADFLSQIRTRGIRNFYITPLINVQKQDGNFVVAAQNYRSAFA